ncbi:MAG TPA: C25 family cysteine peptidase [Thermoanaerobaculia bacterium]|nr:C25 family cysteine peptidase [Thermoanaerobaculia bacterium]
MKALPVLLRPWTLFLAVTAGGFLLPAGAVHGVVNGQCVQARGGQSCTAKDVTFVLVGLGIQTDGCVSSTDTFSIYLGGQLQNTAAQTRYDVGMYIYNNLGTEAAPAVSQGYAFNGSSCARESLKPIGTLNDQRCTFNTPAGSLNLLGGNGPFLNEDGDSCGDLLKVGTSTTCDSNGDGKWDDSFMVFPDPITLKCSDGTNGVADGFVDIPTCATWGQNSDEIGSAGSCTGEIDVQPGNGAKCNCANVNSNVPKPSLALSCSCSPTTVRTGGTNGASTACTVTFANSVACTPNLSTAERFRCGAASFMQFDTVAGTPNGSYIFGQTQGNAPTDTTGGTVDLSTTGTIRWTPRDTVATGGGTGLGIIGHNETGTLSFQYYVDPSVPSGTTINFTTTGYWSNSATFSPRTAQSALTANCSITTSNLATWARVSSFTAREDGGRVFVEWETAAEVGTVAFEVERQDPASGRFVSVSERALPAVQQLPGGRYRLVDPTAPLDKVLTYRLVEIDQQGRREMFGPYPLTVRGETRRAGGDGVRDFTAKAKEISPRLARATAERPALTPKAASTGSGKTAARARVEVTRTGMVRLRSAEIAGALGMDPGQVGGQLRAGRVRLTHAGQDVAWQAADDGDGLVFYGEAIASPYTQVNVYWLECAPGLAMASPAGHPASGSAAGSFLDALHLETDAIPTATAPLPVEDFWIWKSFFPGFPGFDRATFTIDVPAPAASPATLALNLYGFAASQRLSVRVNGQAAGEVAWAGTGTFTGQVTLPAGTLRDGANQIEVVALEADRGVWLDSFDLGYSHAYRASGDRLAFQAGAGSTVDLSGFRSADVAVWDLAQPLAPRRLTGLAAQLRPDGSWGVAFTAPDAGPFLALTAAALDAATVRASAPADLKNPGRGAEYVVIAPAALRSEAQRLAALRSAQGLSVMVVDLGDVMDVFGDGLYDPRAIRSFLSWALRSWPTPPRYVVLAGKGTYDPRNLLGSSTNLLPPWLVSTEEGIAPADNEYADFGGHGVPAVAIGRIPAVTAAELGAYVDKVAAYERDPGGSWTGTALFVSDDADLGGNFAATNDTIIGALGALGPSLAVSRLDLPAASGSSQLQASRSRLFDALRDGQALVNYVGHGGLDRLTSEGLLLTSDVPGLGNGPRVPVVTALTCLISQFAYPTVTSLGEELVLQPGGGAAAVYGPTWLSYNGEAGELGRFLLPRLAAPGGGRLGDRIVRGLADYAAAGGRRETLRLYTLLGDPGLTLKR